VDDIQVFCGLTHLEGVHQGLEPKVGCLQSSSDKDI
jgi:hypothetical protein